MNTIHKTKVYNIIDWKRYLVQDDHPMSKNFVESFGIEVFKHAITSIKTSLDLGTNEFSLFTVKHHNIMSVVLRDDYELLLNYAMTWLIEKEEYESCAEIRDLLIQLKS
jgi:hypothetical protein